MVDEQPIPHEYGVGSPPAGTSGSGPPFGSWTGTAGGAPAPVPSSPDLVADRVVSRPLADRMATTGQDEVIGVVVELRSAHPEGLAGARAAVTGLLGGIAPGAPIRSTRAYLSTALTAEQIRQLVRDDGQAGQAAAGAGGPATDAQFRAAPMRPAPRWAIYRIWPNFEIHGLIYRTVVTTKCDAARRAFDAVGTGIVWAVLDSGIQGDHAHFAMHDNLALPAGLTHRSFVAGADDAQALQDPFGHGTHVAGILAGEQVADRPAGPPMVAATWYQDDQGDKHGQQVHFDRIAGMAPRCTLLSCKVLRDDGSGDITALLAALEYIQDLNHGGQEVAVHGINLSVGYPFDPSWFGTGLTPVCREVDRLVNSGVVVVIAAGNTGYGYALDNGGLQMRLGFEMSINDPGNTERAITVGSTSTQPHLTGVSYFSSKGPTGDGRLKPDLVAPGERVVSAAAGRLLAQARQVDPTASYVENSGTSMAAPHVSGVVAGFLSVHNEFIGRPDDVKQILLDSAVDLRRQPTFQGRGLVDAMRAIQSI
jgi:serine protease AprX